MSDGSAVVAERDLIRVLVKYAQHNMVFKPNIYIMSHWQGLILMLKIGF